MTRIRGIIIPVVWDDQGNALEAAIFASDEHEYFIKQDKKGKDLIKFIKHEIEATGFVSRDSEGNKTLTLNSYEIMPE